MSADPPGGPGRVGGLFQCTGRVCQPFRKSGTGQETILKVQDGSGDHSGGPGWVGGLSQRTGWVGQPLRRTGTGQETVPEVQDG